MQELSMNHNGCTFSNWPPEDIIASGVPADVVQEEIARQNARKKVRGQVNLSVGDTETLLGITADAAAVAIYGLAVLTSKLATAQTVAEVRAAAAPFEALSAEFLAKIESGEVVLPFMVKGVEGVVLDIEHSATSVADALRATQGQ